MHFDIRKNIFAFICFNESPLKLWLILFISTQQIVLFLRYLNVYPDVFGQVGKRLDKKAKVNFNIAKYKACNYNTHIAYVYCIFVLPLLLKK